MKRAPYSWSGDKFWIAYREVVNLGIPLVIKDSWQYLERKEEGEVLRDGIDHREWSTWRDTINMRPFVWTAKTTPSTTMLERRWAK